jgi:hypothetical protein
VQRAIEALGRERVIGIVLNRVDEDQVVAGYRYSHYGNYGSGYGYGYGYGYGPSPGTQVKKQ